MDRIPSPTKRHNYQKLGRRGGDYRWGCESEQILMCCGRAFIANVPN